MRDDLHAAQTDPGLSDSRHYASAKDRHRDNQHPHDTPQARFRRAYAVARLEWRYGPAGLCGLLRCVTMPFGWAAARSMQLRTVPAFRYSSVRGVMHGL